MEREQEHRSFEELVITAKEPKEVEHCKGVCGRKLPGCTCEEGGLHRSTASSSVFWKERSK